MTTQETLVKYISDMYALEEHIAQPLKAQATDKDFAPYPAAQDLVKRIYKGTDNAMMELANAAQGLGGDAHSAMKSAVSAMAGAAAAVVNEARSTPITKKLRDDYTALCLASIGYELLHTTGNALAAPEIAALAQIRLKEVAGFIMELSQEIIPVSVQELSAETVGVDMSSVATSQKNVKMAWTS